jgi:parallel beta-helix repeat protein
MKSNKKLKIIAVIILVVLFTFATMITIKLVLINGDKNVNNFDSEDLRIAGISGKIHIDDANPSINWTVAKKDGICTGNGTYSDPYVIEDLEIDGEGSESCIWIDNSEVYFRIENCTVFNNGFDFYDAGIKLVNVNNGQIFNNNCSNNHLRGIFLMNSNRSIISENIVNNNNMYGISLFSSYNNNISENTINNVYIGILLGGDHRGGHNIVTGNLMNKCGLKIGGNLDTVISHEIDTSNLVNGKPVYYYTNKVNLRSYNLTNAGQVILINCSDSLISNLNISYSTIAISLHYCNNNIISGNTLNNNTYYGIFLDYSDNNYISGNTANNNDMAGIMIWDSNINNVSGNIVNNNHYAGGICLLTCKNITVSENIAKNSKRFHGIYIENSNNIIISGNIVNNNSWSGICLVNSDDNIISGNIANYNGECGIVLFQSKYNTISGNTANYNRWGIVLYESDYNTVSGNNLIRNGDNCIAELNCQGNLIYDNDCTLAPSLAYFPIILTIIIPIMAVSVFIIYQNRKRFRKPQEDLDFL